MFVVFLRFGVQREWAPALKAAHSDWLEKGFADGVFLVAGALQPAAGGVILAHGEGRAALEARVAADPFVAEGIISVEIVEIAPGRTDPRLAFLKA
jgi:uncharacterized protein YciI